MNTCLNTNIDNSESSLIQLSNMIEQAVHDIKSPIEALKSIIDGISNLKECEGRVLNSALNRLNEIVNSLNTKELNSNPTLSQSLLNAIELNDIIQNIIDERKSVFKHVEFTFTQNSKLDFNLVLPVLDFQRSLINLINNAAQACSANGKVEIKLNDDSQNLKLTVKDNGKGISEDNLKKIGERKFSFNKIQGSGLGVYHTKNMLKAINGTFDIYSQENVGTEVEIRLAIQKTMKNEFYEYVLIDNDELVRLTWETKAKMLGVSLLSLSCPELLNHHFDKISKTQTKIYIDSNLDNFVRGEFVAKSLHEKGFKNLFMATGYESNRFKAYSFLTCVGKKPPFKL